MASSAEAKKGLQRKPFKEAKTASQSSYSSNCPCHQKDTPRSVDLQADLQKRLNRAMGQISGIKTMIDENRYCGDVLTQLAAVESAIKSVSALVLQEHLETCVVEQIKKGNTEVVSEVMQLMKKFSRV